MICVRADRPVDPVVRAILREVDRIAGELGLEYFVAGATARDILLTHVHGLNIVRATRDVDFAVAVENWQQFEDIKAALTAEGRFDASQNVPQRLHYCLSDAGPGYPIDIIPFRGVEQPPNTVAWPPEMTVLMSMTGYEEALTAAAEVQIDDNLVVPVISLPGLVVLKLFAWRDRGAGNSKDAQDLVTLFHQYGNAGNQDRLYGREIGLLEAVDYDLDLAGSGLLGRDVRKIAAPTTLAQMLSLFDNPILVDRLVIHMGKALRGIEDPSTVTVAERLLDQFIAGLAGGKGRHIDSIRKA
ncbi:MAG: nucleotidyl transferase AbiEii/AbiGii toxin family protein [Acidiferrobacterales bacterium]